MSNHQHPRPKYEIPPERGGDNGSKPPFEAIGKVSVWAAKHWAKWLASVAVTLVIADNHLTHTNSDAKPLMAVETNLVSLNTIKRETLAEVQDLRQTIGQMHDDLAQVKTDLAYLKGRFDGDTPRRNNGGSPHEQTSVKNPWQMPSVNPPVYPPLTSPFIGDTMEPK